MFQVVFEARIVAASSRVIKVSDSGRSVATRSDSLIRLPNNKDNNNQHLKTIHNQAAL